MGHGLDWGLVGGRHSSRPGTLLEAEAALGSWEATAGRTAGSVGDSGKSVIGLVPPGAGAVVTPFLECEGKGCWAGT